MSALLCVPSAPVGQQAPPARTAALWRSLRGARGPLLLTTGTACAAVMPSRGLI
jgi:hypothetical protein